LLQRVLERVRVRVQVLVLVQGQLLLALALEPVRQQVLVQELERL
jgi:hypothetical protein